MRKATSRFVFVLVPRPFRGGERQKRVLKSGEISSYSVGCAYHLSLHSRDAALIRDIHQKLNNTGLIYEYKDKPDCRLAVGSIDGLLHLFNTVFDVYPLLANNQLMRYSLLKTL